MWYELLGELSFIPKDFITFLKLVWEQNIVSGGSGRMWINIAGSILIVLAFVILAAYGNKYVELQLHYQRNCSYPSKARKEMHEKSLKHISRIGLVWFWVLGALGIIVLVSQRYTISLFIDAGMVLSYLTLVITGLAVGVIFLVAIVYMFYNIYKKYLEDNICWFVNGIKIAFSWLKSSKQKVEEK
jgi:hypothetical protein